jgi:Holliday junction resolvase
MAKEQDYQKKIVTALESKGAYVVKVVAASKKGVPDVLVCYEGYFIGIEVKTPTTRSNVSKLQEYNLKKIQKAGGFSTVAVDISDVAPIIEEIDYEIKQRLKHDN